MTYLPISCIFSIAGYVSVLYLYSPVSSAWGVNICNAELGNFQSIFHEDCRIVNPLVGSSDDNWNRTLTNLKMYGIWHFGSIKFITFEDYSGFMKTVMLLHLLR